jgi:integrase/recombinase XerD
VVNNSNEKLLTRRTLAELIEQDDLDLGLSKALNARLIETGENNKVICDYVKCFGNEIRLSENYKKLNSTILVYISEFHSNKKFKDMTKDDVISFLNSLRKKEDKDPLHKWVSTYNIYLVILARFFKWLYHPDLSPKERHKPPCIDIPCLKRKEQSIYKPTDLWTQDDDLLFLKYCPSKRDRCYHAISRDSSCRPHELLKLNIKDVVFKMTPEGRQYAEVLVNGKTGQRHIPLINSIPYLKDWIDDHPQSGNPNSILICGFSKSLGRAIKIQSLNHIYEVYKKEFFPKLLNNPNVSLEDKTKIQELLMKPWNPYIRRHSALTEKSKILKEHTLRQHAGWSATSNMHQKYIHYFGNESNESILEPYGLINKNKQEIDKLKPTQCPNCNEQNKIDSKFCSKCRMVLSYDAYTQVIEENESEKQSEITKLKNDFDEMKSMFKDVTDFIKLKKEIEAERNYIEYLKKNNEIKSIDKRLSEKGLEEHKHVPSSYLSKLKRERMNSKSKSD